MAKDVKPFRFLQFSDVHLDSSLSSKKLSLPIGKRRERNKEILNTLVKALQVAKDRSADAVLIPGDLWDSESVTSQTIHNLVEAFQYLAPIPIIIAPGNHDYYSSESMYNRDALATRGMRIWPSNVHIFNSADFATFRHPSRSDVSFTGRCFTNNVCLQERLLAGNVPKDSECPINILLFHGSLDGYTGGDVFFPGKHTAPFSVSELSNLEFSYAALGHYHDLTEISVASNPTVFGAYSGCLIGRGLDELGPRYALFVEVSRDKSDKVTTKLEKLELGDRRIVVANLNITGLSPQSMYDAAEAKLKKSGVRSKSDILYLKLEGRYPVGGDPQFLAAKLQDKYYHVVVEDKTRPNYKTDEVDKRTTEGRFIAYMQDLQKQAESSGGTTNDPSSATPVAAGTIEDALYYGLDALTQKRIVLRNVD
jgi:DNA repair exonuclease SbcCD nuclease subunit